MLIRGEITSGNDFYEAAFIFQHGETASDYLFSHVLALEALTKGFDRAKWLSVATLDRYLQLIGQHRSLARNFRSTRSFLTQSLTADDSADEHSNPSTRRFCQSRSVQTFACLTSISKRIAVPSQDLFPVAAEVSLVCRHNVWQVEQRPMGESASYIAIRRRQTSAYPR